MLAFLRGKASDRKLRLFAVVCCRRHWHILADERSRAAVEVGERLADGLAKEPEREVAEAGAGQATAATVLARQTNDTLPEHFIIAARVARYTVRPGGTFELEAGLATTAACRLIVLHETGSRDGRAAENRAMCSTLREMFGNPFRHLVVDPSWLTSTVVALARSIYESRDFSVMPILADALEDAGCANADILEHCRGPGPHVRGCHVLDLILGKQ
jgi:hypothetical protein